MRLKDADVMSRKFADYVRPSNNSDFEDVPTWNDAVSLVLNTPIIEAEPIKHGRWLKIGDCNTVQCSECFYDFDYIYGLCYLCHDQELPNFCPNCGAKMDLDEVEK